MSGAREAGASSRWAGGRPAMVKHSETTRQVVHMAMGGFALTLRALTWQQASLLAAAAFLFNLVVLPRVGGRRLYRATDEARGYPVGILLYPVAVLLLILLFRHRLDLAAAAWGILAFGDGAATLAGRRPGRRKLPWNDEKTWAGLAAFVAAGSAAGALLAGWTAPAIQPPPPTWFVVLAPTAAACLAGLAETLPVRLDDNLTVPAAAALVLWTASLVTPDAWAASRPDVVDRLVMAVLVNGAAAGMGWTGRAVTLGGASAGFLIGVVVFAATGWRGWLLLLAAFLSAAVTSRVGLARKTMLGIAEARGGRRGAANAVANTGLAALAAALAAATPYADAARVAFVAALVAGASDTVASEIGKARGGRTWLVTTLARVPPGTPGAVSLAGTLAGLISAALLAGLAAALDLVPWAAAPTIVAAATAAAFIESALAAAFEGPGVLDNDLLNLLNTAAGAGLAVLVFVAWS